MYFPGELGTIVPKAAKIVVPDGTRVVEPVFTVRRYGFEDGVIPKEIVEAGGGDEVSTRRLHWYRLRMETQHTPCCHGERWCYLLERFRETHPEYFMLAAKSDGTYFRDTELPTKTMLLKGHLWPQSKVGRDLSGRARLFPPRVGRGRGIPRGKWGLNTSATG